MEPWTKQEIRPIFESKIKKKHISCMQADDGCIICALKIGGIIIVDTRSPGIKYNKQSKSVHKSAFFFNASHLLYLYTRVFRLVDIIVDLTLN